MNSYWTVVRALSSFFHFPKLSQTMNTNLLSLQVLFGGRLPDELQKLIELFLLDTSRGEDGGMVSLVSKNKELLSAWRYVSKVTYANVEGFVRQHFHVYKTVKKKKRVYGSNWFQFWNQCCNKFCWQTLPLTTKSVTLLSNCKAWFCDGCLENKYKQCDACEKFALFTNPFQGRPCLKDECSKFFCFDCMVNQRSIVVRSGACKYWLFCQCTMERCNSCEEQFLCSCDQCAQVKNWEWYCSNNWCIYKVCATCAAQNNVCRICSSETVEQDSE